MAFAADMYGEGKVIDVAHPEDARKMAGALAQNQKTWRGRAEAALKQLTTQPNVDASEDRRDRLLPRRLHRPATRLLRGGPQGGRDVPRRAAHPTAPRKPRRSRRRSHLPRGEPTSSSPRRRSPTSRRRSKGRG